MDAIFSNCSTSITELKRNPSRVILESGNSTVVILNHNKPMAYLVPAEAYEALLDRLEDAELAAIAKERTGERNDAVKVELDEL